MLTLHIELFWFCDPWFNNLFTRHVWSIASFWSSFDWRAIHRQSAVISACRQPAGGGAHPGVWDQRGRQPVQAVPARAARAAPYRRALRQARAGHEPHRPRGQGEVPHRSSADADASDADHAAGAPRPYAQVSRADVPSCRRISEYCAVLF